ncbi:MULTISPECIES: type II toxin-antitoxin system death-on-curing family toxin [Gordonia]|uniref:type II toxin-antitoxin system death-on-curing family toxin n=1 Tax=Gordonia TaxID=2053 RepID=UPI0001DD968F|nr:MULTISPECIES: type II toxin-antitoxin system death-on-curing family toxin [Gordonia]ADK69016.1 Prophage maintenance system killer protein [Gordonia sp. KTR9]MCZ4581599.1 type II toxin-antitoxin system death-on-curing family toxin [Gordonia amicalis]
MTDFLDREDVLTAGSVACGEQLIVRDEGLLQAAVARPLTSVFGVEAYPNLWDKAAALMHSLARNHPFVDGNKRTSWASANVFLHINGIMPTVDLDVDRAEVFVNDVAKGVIDEWADIADGLHYLYGLSHRSLPINSPVKDDRRER